MIVLDTNALLRFLTRDLEEQAEKVKKLFEGKEIIFVPDVVFPEIEYVLKSFYKASRRKIVNAFEIITKQENIRVNEEVYYAIELYSEYTFDMADCIIAAYSFSSRLASFDKKLLKIKEVTPYWK